MYIYTGKAPYCHPFSFLLFDLHNRKITFYILCTCNIELYKYIQCIFSTIKHINTTHYIIYVYNKMQLDTDLHPYRIHIFNYRHYIYIKINANIRQWKNKIKNAMRILHMKTKPILFMCFSVL